MQSEGGGPRKACHARVRRYLLRPGPLPLERHGRGLAAADADGGYMPRATSYLAIAVNSGERGCTRARAPIGWPSAQAPPCTLSLSCSIPRSRIAAIGTTANASFTSKRPTSSLLSLRHQLPWRSPWARPSCTRPAPARGWRSRRCGRAVRSRASSEARISTSEAAPSEIELELAAVTVPSAEHGLQLRDAGRISGKRLLVARDDPLAGAPVDLVQRDLGSEGAVLVGRARAPPGFPARKRPARRA